MKKLILIAVAALIALALLAFVVAGFYVDTIAKKSVEKVGPMLTKTTVTVDGVNLSILSGGGSIKGLTVGNPEGYKSPTAIKVGDAKMELSPGTVFSEKVVIRTINVRAPEITYETDFKGSNLNKLLANVEEATGIADNTDEGPGKKLQVDDFLITDAKVSVALTQLGGQKVTVPIPDIHLKDLGQGPEGITVADLMKRVFASIEASSVQAASKAVGDVGSTATEAAKNAASTAADAVKKGVGGLLKRK